MAAIDIKFDVSELDRRLRTFRSKVKNLPMDVLGNLMLSATEDVFDSEGATGTEGPWESLSEETIRRHPRRSGGQLLQDFGILANVQVIETGPFHVTIASPASYSTFHLDGTENMPARNFFALNFDSLFDEYGDIILQEFQR